MGHPSSLFSFPADPQKGHPGSGLGILLGMRSRTGRVGQRARDTGEDACGPRWLAQLWQLKDDHAEGHPLLAMRGTPVD